MKTIKLAELKRLAFCNSDKLRGNKYIIGDKVNTWVGIGFVENSKIKPDPKIHITVVD